jgi:hypothetical protein
MLSAGSPTLLDVSEHCPDLPALFMVRTLV